MSQNKTIILDFIDSLDSAQEFTDCFDALTRCVEALGFDGLVYTSIPIGLEPLVGKTGPVFMRSDGYNDHFLAHYESEGFASDDFTIKRILNQDLRVMDWWREQRKGALLDTEKHVIEVAREDYGITNGLSVPMLSTQYQIAGASVISGENDETFQRLLRERLAELKTIIRLFHDHVYANAGLQKVFYIPLLETLSHKERQLLKFIATGLPLKTIDNHYDICPGYATNLRAGLYRKLHVNNINQLNYVLGLHRILEML